MLTSEAVEQLRRVQGWAKANPDQVDMSVIIRQQGYFSTGFNVRTDKNGRISIKDSGGMSFSPEECSACIAGYLLITNSGGKVYTTNWMEKASRVLDLHEGDAIELFSTRNWDEDRCLRYEETYNIEDIEEGNRQRAELVVEAIDEFIQRYGQETQ